MIQDSRIGPLVPLYAILVVGLFAFFAFADPYGMLFGRPVYRPSPAAISNAKQQALALIMYSEDSDNRLPPRDLWMSATRGYTKNDLVFRDPYLKDLGPQHLGFAVARDADRKAIADVRQPEELLLVFQSWNLSENASGDASSARAGISDKCAAAFADGHAVKLELPALAKAYDVAYREGQR